MILLSSDDAAEVILIDYGRSRTIPIGEPHFFDLVDQMIKYRSCGLHFEAIGSTTQLTSDKSLFDAVIKNVSLLDRR